MRALLIVLLAVVASICGWMLFSPMRGEAAGVGVNTLVENDVTTASAGQEAWKPAVVGADVFFGDRIATAADSRLEVRLLDRSNLTVGSNARLTIDRFIYDPSRNAVGAMVSVVTGAFRYASDEGKPEQVSFRTPGATIGIRGTVIEGVVGPEAVALIAGLTAAPDLTLDADSAAVIILRSGAADVRAGGRMVVLDQPGQAVILSRRQVYPAFVVTPETNRRFETLLPPDAKIPAGPVDPAGEEPVPDDAAPTATATPATPPAGSTTPPTRQPPRDAVTRPQRPVAPSTRPSPDAPMPPAPQRAGPATGPAGQPPLQGPAQGSQQPGAQQPPAGNPAEARAPLAGTAPGAAPPDPTAKPADGSQPQSGQAQPGRTQTEGERPTGGQPSTTPPATRPTQPSVTRPIQPQTQPRQQPVAPGGGVAGPGRN